MTANRAAKIVTVAQQKGGAGKTTIAVQLAISWMCKGLTVIMLDVDPQHSLSAWAHARAEAGLGSAPQVIEVPGWKLSSEIDRHKNKADIILVDTPPHAETDARVAVRASSLLLVPVQPSPMDLWATGPTLELARKEKGNALLVLNRVPARGKLADIVRDKMAKDKLPIATATLGNRSAFAASMMEGKGVAETHPRSLAAQEIDALADEITKVLKTN